MDGAIHELVYLGFNHIHGCSGGDDFVPVLSGQNTVKRGATWSVNLPLRYRSALKGNFVSNHARGALGERALPGEVVLKAVCSLRPLRA
jgi:hypothetical protein